MRVCVCVCVCGCACVRARVCDAAAQDFDAVAYSSKYVKFWTSGDISNLTSNPAVGDVAFIDMHVQPSADRTLHDLLAAMAGKISGRLMASQVRRAAPQYNAARRRATPNSTEQHSVTQRDTVHHGATCGNAPLLQHWPRGCCRRCRMRPAAGTCT